MVIAGGGIDLPQQIAITVPKDETDWIQIAGLILVPIVVAAIGYFGNKLRK